MGWAVSCTRTKTFSSLSVMVIQESFGYVFITGLVVDDTCGSVHNTFALNIVIILLRDLIYDI